MKHKYRLGTISLVSALLLSACGGGGSSGGSNTNPTPGPTNSPTPGPTNSPTPGPTNSPTPVPSSIKLSDVIKTYKSGCEGKTKCLDGLYLVDDKTQDLANIGDNLHTNNQQGEQWSNDHYAILAKPGTYSLSKPFNLGYYTQILGLGSDMNQVTISPYVGAFNQGSQLPSDKTDCLKQSNSEACEKIGALNNFWRGIENFTMDNTTGNYTGGTIIFAVSQSSPIRNINFKPGSAGITLFCDYHGTPPSLTPPYNQPCGFASGGFMANSVVNNSLSFGSQQQWYTRNSQVSGGIGSTVWNTVLSGTTGTINTADAACGTSSKPCRQVGTWSGSNGYTFTNQSQTPISIEKPFLTCGTTCANPTATIDWKVMVPTLKTNSVGIDTYATATSLDVNSTFFVVAPELGQTSSTGVTTLDATVISNINSAIAAGKNILITPGVYNLDGGTINVNHDNTIVLGLGLPDLVCTSGKPCIEINTATKGIDIAGITLDAGYTLTPSLLQIGSATDTTGSSTNPISLHDVFFRIAETQVPHGQTPPGIRQTTAALVIYKNNVIADYMWIWRADHDKNSQYSENSKLNLVNWNQDKAKYGLVVYGDNVSIDGLMVEHFQDYQTVWYGNNGKVTFYQSEIPYDVPSLTTWQCTDPKTGAVESTGKGCASYVVNGNNHTAQGMGVYSYYANSVIMSQSGYLIKDSALATLSMTNLIGKWLDGTSGSGYHNLVTNSSHTTCWGYGITGSATSASALSVLGGVSPSGIIACP